MRIPSQQDLLLAFRHFALSHVQSASVMKLLPYCNDGDVLRIIDDTRELWCCKHIISGEAAIFDAL